MSLLLQQCTILYCTAVWQKMILVYDVASNQVQHVLATVLHALRYALCTSVPLYLPIAK
jgi:hypothetical protein